MSTTTTTSSLRTVHVDLEDAWGGLPRGRMTWEPLHRLRGGGRVVLPSPRVFGGVGVGLAAYDVALIPTDSPDYPGDWCWKVTEPAYGQTRYVLVPSGTVALNYPDLADVDPRTFAASAVPPPAWTARVDQLQAQLADTTAALAAAVARITALEGGSSTPGYLPATLEASL